MKALIWSRDQCVYCEWAKNLLEDNSVDYEERNVSQDWNTDDMRDFLKESPYVDPSARVTMPQIFLDGKYIGGFSELNKYFKDLNKDKK